eukprot:jgi/Orpsp1_1/1180210/evm.model.c7180000072521.1
MKLLYIVSALCLYIFSIVFAKDTNFYTGTWASSQYFNGELPEIEVQGNTLRQIVRVSIPGEELRFKFSNLYGLDELELLSVHVAKSAGQGTGSIVLDTDTAITFNGNPSVVIPAGADVASDVLPFAISSFDELAITIHYGKTPADLTGHAGSRTNSYIELGDAVSKETFTHDHKFAHWYTIAAIDVVDNERKHEAIACFGDSITDGRGTTTDKQNRWTDVFAEKLQSQPATAHFAVLNHGIGATTLIGKSTPKFPSGIERFQKDVVEQSNVKYVIVLYGINDINNDRTADELIETFKELVKKAHDNDMIIYGVPILPCYTSNNWNDDKEQIRETVNDWILNTPASEGGFDATIDMASVVADPQDIRVLNYDLSDKDGLHPNYLGYNVMGNVIDLNLFIKDDENAAEDVTDISDAEGDVDADVSDGEDSADDEEETEN